MATDESKEGLTPREVGFEAWVLIPNVLNTVLNAPEKAVAAGLVLDRRRLEKLHATLEHVTPPHMSATLRCLPPEDRLLLLHACEACLSGDESRDEERAAALGSTPGAAAAVMQILRHNT